MELSTTDLFEFDNETLVTCAGYLGKCNAWATQGTEFCDACGEAIDWDVASDCFKDDYGFRPRMWTDVSEARAFLDERRAGHEAEAKADAKKWADLKTHLEGLTDE